MIYLWLAIVILLTIAELLTVNLVTIWYVASGILTMILTFFIDDFFIQLGVFTIVGTVLLITTRSTFTRILKLKSEKTNYDRIVGHEAVVSKRITKNETGEVTIDGNSWRAKANKSIKKGVVVIIKGFEGNKVIVEEEK